MGDMLRHDAERLRILVERHKLHTGSKRAAALLDDWDTRSAKFVKVMPRDYAKRAAPARSRARRSRHGRGRVGLTRMGKETGFLEFDRAGSGYARTRRSA